MSQWYYTQNGQQGGPVDDAQLNGMIASGQLGPSDMVWREGMAEWQAVTAVPELGGGPYSTTPGYGVQPSQPLNYGGYAPVQPSYYSGGVSYRKDAQSAMICSIIGICCCVFLAIYGLVQGNKAKNNMRASGNMDGEGMATAAVVIGWIAVVFAVVMFIIRMAAFSTHSY